MKIKQFLLLQKVTKDSKTNSRHCKINNSLFALKYSKNIIINLKKNYNTYILYLFKFKTHKKPTSCVYIFNSILYTKIIPTI